MIVRQIFSAKSPGQEAYYRHQLYLYNFTVVQGYSEGTLNKYTTFDYNKFLIANLLNFPSK